jgi:hypothetical protein
MNYPEIVSIKKQKIMKTLNFELSKDIFNAFALSTEEMINIRGGEGDPIVKPTEPIVRI